MLEEVCVPAECSKLEDRSSAPWGLEMEGIPKHMPRLAGSSLLYASSLGLFICPVGEGWEYLLYRSIKENMEVRRVARS